MSSLTIRAVRIEDAAELAEIYNYFVVNTAVTFDVGELSVDALRAKLEQVSESHPWVVAMASDRIVAYAHATAWKSRCAYERTVETTIYVRPECSRQGTGFRLYGELLDLLEKNGTHTALGGIAQPNEASVRLHERLGFKKVGRLEEVGFKFDRWIDVEYWQKRFRG